MSRPRELAGSILLAVVAVALSARVDVPLPGTPVPQSLQTLAVVVVGGLLGGHRGVLALAAYLFAGAVGLPVFAGGAAGMAVLAGPTAGYLFGFVVAAGMVGWMRDRGHLLRFVPTFAVMVAAHLAILSMGWARLSTDLGMGAAWDAGVAPFLVGGVIKSILAATLIVLVPVRPRSPAQPSVP